MPFEIHYLYYTWKQVHSHTVKSKLVTYDHVRHMKHIAQNSLLYVGPKSSLLLESKCHTHHTPSQAKLEDLEVIYSRFVWSWKEKSKNVHTSEEYFWPPVQQLRSEEFRVQQGLFKW